jgi:hypothetical protein
MSGLFCTAVHDTVEQSLAAADILDNAERAKPFLGGPVLLMRLSPVD